MEPPDWALVWAYGSSRGGGLGLLLLGHGDRLRSGRSLVAPPSSEHGILPSGTSGRRMGHADTVHLADSRDDHSDGSPSPSILVSPDHISRIDLFPSAHAGHGGPGNDATFYGRDVVTLRPDPCAPGIAGICGQHAGGAGRRVGSHVCPDGGVGSASEWFFRRGSVRGVWCHGLVGRQSRRECR